jgi:ssDNA-binding Zn-finger/Zn-ribbon topoisomerase 1
LIHIPVQREYSQSELKSRLSTYLSGTQVNNKQREQDPESSPRCPKCGREMILRTAKRGDNQGEKFWGCSRYPECRGIVNGEIK